MTHIAFEGVIGAGKTTFASKIATILGGKLVLEQFEDNPFLANFYQQKEKYALQVELFFLASRFHQYKDSSVSNDLFATPLVSDFVFYKSLVFASINLKNDEMLLYRKLFDIMFTQIPKPDLTIYLNLPMDALLKNIQKRGRTYEKLIAPAYLEQLHENYVAFFKQLTHHKIVVFNCEDYDIYTNPNTIPKLLEIIETPFQEGIHYV